MRLDYKTRLIWSLDKRQIHPFYKYNNNIGYIPADISVTSRNKHYTTSGLMELIVKLHTMKAIPKTDFRINHWLHTQSPAKINASKFMAYYKQCENLVKPSRKNLRI